MIGTRSAVTGERKFAPGGMVELLGLQEITPGMIAAVYVLVCTIYNLLVYFIYNYESSHRFGMFSPENRYSSPKRPRTCTKTTTKASNNWRS